MELASGDSGMMILEKTPDLGQTSQPVSLPERQRLEFEARTLRELRIDCGGCGTYQQRGEKQKSDGEREFHPTSILFESRTMTPHARVLAYPCQGTIE
jgi:hypothetical protein